MLKSKKHKWDLFNILVVSPREQNQIETFAPDFQIVLLRKISNLTETSQVWLQSIVDDFSSNSYKKKLS